MNDDTHEWKVTGRSLFFLFYFQTRRVFYFLRRERENDKVNTPSKMSVRSFRRSTTRRRGEKTLPKRKSPVVVAVVVVVARLESIARNSY